MHYKINERRFYLIFSLLIFSLFLLLARLIYIQLIRSQYLASLANRQHSLFLKLQPKRGSILDRNLDELAVSLNVDSLYALPPQIADKEELSRHLAPILEMDENILLEKLKRDKSFVWLARGLSPQVSGKIRELKIEGIGFLKEAKRFYPNSSLASHLLGFVGLDNRGLEGLELFYDEFLRGSPGWRSTIRDAKQREVISLGEEVFAPKDGYDLILTIDKNIQYIAERQLQEAYQAFKAKAAMIIVMEPETGQILALACRPTFDPNFAARFPPELRRNRAICDLFEPGSVFKIVTASAALEEEIVGLQENFFCEKGKFRIANHLLHDYRAYGWLTFSQIIEQSSNIGVAKVAIDLGPEVLYKYIQAFGFGSPTGIDFPGEVAGIARPPKDWSKVSIATIPIGQGVAITTIQLAQAISAIANDGLLMRPYLVRAIRDKDSRIIKSFRPKVVRQVISPDTAQLLKRILEGVVERGTGRRARIPGFRICGKTGTAQKLETSGRYSHSHFMASFVGFLPVEAPRFSITVVIDDPHPFYYGGVVAAPVFQRVADQLLRYMKISLQESRDEIKKSN